VSFASRIKEELAALPAAGSRCCRMAELYGLCLFASRYSAGELKLTSEHRSVVRQAAMLLWDELGLVAEVEAKGATGYCLSLSPEDSARLFATLSGDESRLSLRIDRGRLECEDCLSAFLRGVFFSCGFITDPEKGYHLEFVTPHRQLGADLSLLLTELAIVPGSVLRKNVAVIYVKDSEGIEDFLSRIGAVGAAFDIMNVKITKDVRNKSNRIANCETANMAKTADGAVRACQAIRKLKRSGRLAALSPELQETARLRLAYPEAPLRELGELHDPAIGKSGVNHRLKKLLELAETPDPVPAGRGRRKKVPADAENDG